MLIWNLLDRRLGIFDANPSNEALTFVDLVFFILGFIGINGRLSTIAHEVGDLIRSFAKTISK